MKVTRITGVGPMFLRFHVFVGCLIRNEQGRTTLTGEERALVAGGSHVLLACMVSVKYPFTKVAGIHGGRKRRNGKNRDKEENEFDETNLGLY